EATPAIQTLALHAQYLRDLSFESPTAPASFTRARKTAPKIEIHLEPRCQPLETNVYEVVLRLRLTAKLENEVGKDNTPPPEKATAKENEENAPLFVVEIEYAGVFSPPTELNEEDKRRILLVDGAQLLFPFLRRILAEITQEGSFLPVLLNPIDFLALYNMRQQAEAQRAAAVADAPQPEHRNGAGISVRRATAPSSSQNK
ncbi:MAG: protein-export chaperone SecB, partial [Alphaproteobacteria bacterium]